MKIRGNVSKSGPWWLQWHPTPAMIQTLHMSIQTFVISVTSHRRHGFSDPRQLDCSFNTLLRQPTSITVLYHRPMMRKLHWWPVDSPHLMCLHSLAAVTPDKLCGKHFHVITHDDVIKWKHFPRYWPFVRGIQRSPVNSPHKGQWRGVLMFSLICAWINGWIDNREAGNLRRYRAHYDVSVMHWLRVIMIGWTI